MFELFSTILLINQTHTEIMSIYNSTFLNDEFSSLHRARTGGSSVAASGGSGTSPRNNFGSRRMKRTGTSSVAASGGSGTSPRNK